MPPSVPGEVGNLPFELTSFVDRRRELGEARQLLSVSRLVMLTGMGGVGKTRLALRVAARVRRVFEDGVWLVDLGQVQDRALVAHTVVATLGLQDQSGRPPLAMLSNYLASRRVLLVLDNCEHLGDAVAKVADALLRSCPDLRVLATSREPLGIDGETTLSVSPLSVPDPQRPPSLRGLSRFEAVTLFAERAAAVVPGFSLTEDNRVVVAEICHRLDGLPLAIELAAARLRALSAKEILHRLSDRYRLLSIRTRAAPARLQTLRSCVEWSYELCTPTEQLLWARLAVFPGGFELDAAQDICDSAELAPEDLPDLVASLVDKSILIEDEHGTVTRYRQLDTIRAYGQERLRETGEDTALRRRHRDWYERLALRAEADWISPRQVNWFARLDREQPNLRAALEFCLTEPGEAEAALRIATTMYRYWFARGLLSEGRQWLDRALAHHPRPTTDRIRALYADSILAGHQSGVNAASALVEEGREIAQQLGDTSTRALITLASGCLAGFRGDLPHAVALLEEALDAFRTEDNVPRLIEAHYMLAVNSGLLGDATRALASHKEVLAITEPRGEVWYRSISLWALGLAVWPQGDPRRAAGLVEQSLRLKRLIDDPLGSAWCLDALAWIAASERDARRAATLLGAAEELWQAIGTSPATGQHLLGYHEECERQARRALGEQAFQDAFRRGRGLSFADAIAYALGEKPQAAPSPAEPVLTRRERQVADLVAEGLTDKEIAARLVISQRTAETHVDHIRAKLGLTSRTQIAAWVAQPPANGQDHGSRP